MDTRFLEELGLSKNESIIYLTLLKLGIAKASTILKESKLNTGKIYLNLESLKEKNLISETIKNNIKHFQASPPEELNKYIDQKEQKIQKEREIIKKNIPFLEKLRKETSPKLFVKSYSGLRGIRVACLEALNSLKEGEEMTTIHAKNTSAMILKSFWLNLNQRRVEKKVKIRILLEDKSEYYKSTKNYPLRQIRFQKKLTQVAIATYGKEITLIADYVNNNCIFIKNPGITESFINSFNQQWENAEK